LIDPADSLLLHADMALTPLFGQLDLACPLEQAFAPQSGQTGD